MTDWSANAAVTKDEARARYAEGEKKFKDGDYAGASEIFFALYQTGVGDIDVSQGKIAYNMGLCFKKQEQWDDALSWFHEAMTMGDAATKDDVEDLIREVRLARDGVTSPTQTTAKDARHQLQDGLAAYHEQRFDDALTTFTALYQSSVGGDAAAQPRLAYYIGLCLSSLDRSDEAVTWYEEAAHHPDADGDTKSGASEALRHARVGSEDLDVDAGLATSTEATQYLQQAEDSLLTGDHDAARTTAESIYNGYGGEVTAVRAHAAVIVGDALRAQSRFEEAAPWYEDVLGLPASSIAAEVRTRADEGLRSAHIGTTQDDFHSDAAL